MSKYTFVDNSDIILKAMRGAMDESAEEIKTTLVEAVQEKMLYGYNDRHGSDGHTEIVDTGRLFDSIDADVRRVSQNTVEIKVGSTGDTNYSVYVHEGTHKLKGRPFITDGVEESTEKVKEILTRNVRDA